MSLCMHDRIHSVRRVQLFTSCYDPVFVSQLNRWPFVSVFNASPRVEADKIKCLFDSRCSYLSCYLPIRFN